MKYSHFLIQLNAYINGKQYIRIYTKFAGNEMYIKIYTCDSTISLDTLRSQIDQILSFYPFIKACNINISLNQISFEQFAYIDIIYWLSKNIGTTVLKSEVVDIVTDWFNTSKISNIKTINVCIKGCDTGGDMATKFLYSIHNPYYQNKDFPLSTKLFHCKSTPAKSIFKSTNIAKFGSLGLIFTII